MVLPLGRRRRVKQLGYYCIGPTVTPAKIEAYQRRLQQDSGLGHIREQLFLLGARRLDILYLLSRESELCVCDLADILIATVSAVSHQLRILRQHKLVQPRRHGQTIFYSLTERATKLVRSQEKANGHI